MAQKDKFNIAAPKSDAASRDEGEPLEHDQQEQSQQWWESAMFTEPAQESER